MGESLVIMRFGKVMTDTVYVLMKEIGKSDFHYYAIAVYRNKFPIDQRLMVAIGYPDDEPEDYFLIARTIYTMPY